jgi:hypothetical protein
MAFKEQKVVANWLRNISLDLRNISQSKEMFLKQSKIRLGYHDKLMRAKIVLLCLKFNFSSINRG